MFDSLKELMDKIRLGEDSFLEFKEVRFTGEKISAPHRDSMADEFAAFSNARGGVLVLGVDDATREILGIPVARLDAVERVVFEVCAQRIDPPLAPVIERLWLPSVMGEELAVLKIELQRSLFVHRSPGGYMHRIGSSNRIMHPDYLARLFQQRSQARIIWFDEQVVPKATLDDLSSQLWQRFASTQTTNSRESLLSKLGMARNDNDSGLLPTVTGVLMATQDPRKWLPNAYIQAVSYKGSKIGPEVGRSTYQLDAMDISGPLDTQVIEACRFIVRNMKVAASKEHGRVDQPQFDMTAIFEAIVNAVAHRDYSIHGSKIRLRVFEDRLELYSPGAITNTMTVESLPYRQSTRNEAISSLLARCPVPTDTLWLTTDRATMMDKRGEGVRIILDNSQRLSGRTPEYRLIDETELLLTIYSEAIS